MMHTKKKDKIIEPGISDLQDNRQSNIYAIRVLEGEKRDGWTQKISEEIMAENVPNLMKSINSLTQEAKQTSRRISIFLKTHQGTSQSNY